MATQVYTMLYFFICFIIVSSVITQKIDRKGRKYLMYRSDSCTADNLYSELVKLAKVTDIGKKCHGVPIDIPTPTHQPKTRKNVFHTKHNDEQVRKSINAMSYNQYLKSSGRAQHIDMNKPVIQEFPKYETKYRKNHFNLKSYISYFIFALTPELENIMNEKMEKNNWDFRMHLTETDYEIIMAHLVYTGSGRQSRPFDHLRVTDNVLCGKFAKKGRKLVRSSLSFFLAKAKLEERLKNVLIVPFAASEGVSPIAYNEYASIWSSKNLTFNTRDGDFSKFIFKFCVQQNDPRKYLKNVYSKQALQCLADQNIELGIRQMKDFGVKQPIVDSMCQHDKKAAVENPTGVSYAALWKKDKIKLNIFGFKLYSEHTLATKRPKKVVIMLPFDAIDFDFKGWLVKVNLINTITNHLNVKLDCLPNFRDILLTALKPDFDKINNNDGYDKNLLSEILIDFYTIIENEIEKLKDKTEKITVPLIVLKFQAALEYELFGRLIVGNEDTKYPATEAKPTDKKIAKVPLKFLSLKATEQLEERTKGDQEGDKCNLNYECKYHKRSFATKALLEIHMETEEHLNRYDCKICRKSFVSKHARNAHFRDSLNHIVQAIGQGIPSNRVAWQEKLTSSYTCPIEKHENFRYESECLEHIKSHTDYDNQEPYDRLEEDRGKGKGIFKCNICTEDEFATDDEGTARNHYRDVHWFNIHKDGKKWNFFDNEWKKHFKIDHENQLGINFKTWRCILPVNDGICGHSSDSRANVLNHLLTTKHDEEFKMMEKDKKPEYKQVAIKRKEFLKCYSTRTEAMRAGATSKKFLDIFVENTKTATTKTGPERFHFTKYPALRDRIRTERTDITKGFRDASEALQFLVSRLKPEFYEADDLEDLRNDFKDRFKVDLLTSVREKPFGFHSKEVSFIFKHQVFREYIYDEKNPENSIVILRDDGEIYKPPPTSKSSVKKCSKN